MSTEARRTLVVDLDSLDKLREQLRGAYEGYPNASTLYKAQLDVLDIIIRHGTTVPLDHLTVVELATPVRETPWQEKERERFYSEAHAVDADWTPAGGAA